MRVSMIGLAVLSLLASCGSAEDATQPSVTVNESDALNAATEMLDASPDGMSMSENAALDSESASDR